MDSLLRNNNRRFSAIKKIKEHDGLPLKILLTFDKVREILGLSIGRTERNKIHVEENITVLKGAAIDCGAKAKVDATRDLIDILRCSSVKCCTPNSTFTLKHYLLTFSLEAYPACAKQD